MAAPRRPARGRAAAGDRDRRRALGRRRPARPRGGGRLPARRRAAHGPVHEPPGAPRAPARNVTQIELRPLTAEAAGELAEALLPDKDRALAGRVAQASGGNPFFAEEVAQAIVEGRGGAADHLPDTVQAAIAAQLDLLPPREKRTLQHASVLGPNFLEEALDDLLREPSAPALADLAQKTLVQERLAIGPGRFGFRHHLIRDVAYAA